MALLKRTITTVAAKIDQLVGEIENHDALIQAAIGEQKKKIAAAKVQLRRMQENEHRLASQIAECAANDKRWTERARQVAANDEEKALACLQRRNRNRDQIQKMKLMQAEYQRSVIQMRQNIQRCEEELRGMVQKHQVLRARQCTADAMQIIDRDGAATLPDVETSFECWETKTAPNEYLVDNFDTTDELEREFVDAETQEALRDELAELLADSEPVADSQTKEDEQ